jgi:hypothetical protein
VFFYVFSSKTKNVAFLITPSGNTFVFYVIKSKNNANTKQYDMYNTKYLTDFMGGGGI